MTHKIQIDDLVRDANSDEIAAIEVIVADAAAIEIEKQAIATLKVETVEKLIALGIDPKALGL
jgi:tryptophanyl-tRNA synthetase